MKIHHTAIVAPSAELAEDVEVGPYSVIEDHVVIGKGSKIGNHVNIGEHTTIGDECEIHQGAVVGGVPQDKKFQGEPTQTIVGNRNVIREYVTINRGTSGGGGKTSLGDGNLIMCYVHIAHDCHVSNNVIMSAYSGLAGHIVVDDGAVISPMVGVHHFCRIGEMAYVGGMSKVTQDIPPYIMADGNPCRFRGLNLVGLRRNKLTAGAIAALKESYRILFMHKRQNLIETLDEIKTIEEFSFPEVQKLVAFIEERSQNFKGRYLENSRDDGDGMKDESS